MMMDDFQVGNPSNFADENADSDHPMLQDQVRDHRDSHDLGIWTNHASTGFGSGNPSNQSSRARAPRSFSQVFGINLVFFDGHGEWKNGSTLEHTANESNTQIKFWSVNPE